MVQVGEPVHSQVMISAKVKILHTFSWVELVTNIDRTTASSQWLCSPAYSIKHSLWQFEINTSSFSSCSPLCGSFPGALGCLTMAFVAGLRWREKMPVGEYFFSFFLLFLFLLASCSPFVSANDVRCASLGYFTGV